ncbi:unnamed protein product [Medioppia subpectinata]|uniref:NR LBD domain-containing protein n=1 Tax=Medioppia subpectinata TaxID=1979941 RepID=A0A7R9Q2P4_9ACAR|nr:unnamed protein product [Medioppia subpectinata]CAG2110488.1 unnamed protein product [Medioppia subpectinata]
MYISHNKWLENKRREYAVFAAIQNILAEIFAPPLVRVVKRFSGELPSKLPYCIAPPMGCAKSLPKPANYVKNADLKNDKELSEQIDEIKRCLTGETEATKQIRQKSAAMAIVPIVKPIVDYCGINQLESSRMTELSDACLMTEIIIQDVITFTKRLRGFQKFCANDQLALLKHGFLDIIYLQGFTCYDPEEQEFNYCIDEYHTLAVSLDALKVYRKSIYDILEQQLYIYLLQRYLLLKCGSESESKPRLQALMYSLTDLTITGETHKRIELSEVAENHTLIQYYGPLFREIYDL